MIKYISRYLDRPVIASSRIDHYDGQLVTFHYNRHEDNAYVEETIPAMADSMHTIVILIKSSTVSFQKKNMYFSKATSNGEALLDMDYFLKDDELE